MGRDSGLTRVPGDLWPAKVVACIAAMNVIKGKGYRFYLKKNMVLLCCPPTTGKRFLFHVKFPLFAFVSPLSYQAKCW